MLQQAATSRLDLADAAHLAGLAVLIGARHLAAAAQALEGGLMAKIAARVHAPPIRLRATRCDIAETGDSNTCMCASQAASTTTRSATSTRRRPPASAGMSTRRWSTRRGASCGSTAASCPTPARTRQRAAQGSCPARSRCAGLVARAARRGPLHARQRCRRATSGTGRTQPPCRVGLRRQGQSALVPFIDRRRRPARAAGRLPQGGVTRLDLPNRHLEYALTWYGLALTLIGVYSPPSPPAGCASATRRTSTAALANLLKQ